MVQSFLFSDQENSLDPIIIGQVKWRMTEQSRWKSKKEDYVLNEIDDADDSQLRQKYQN